jgi:GNAT superfamily N-acetyltransferase
MEAAGRLRIREARDGDVETLFELILELSVYERLRDEVSGDPDLLRRALFEARTAEALLAELDGMAVGYAVFCGTFSTFECRAGIWIEDLYVRPGSRRGGIGRALFGRIAEIALERGCPRVEWAVLDWNRLGLDFYERLGARHMDDWRLMRVDGEALRRLGAV